VAEGFSWAASRKPRLWRGSAPRAAPGQAALSGWGLLMGSYHLGGGACISWALRGSLGPGTCALTPLH